MSLTSEHQPETGCPTPTCSATYQHIPMRQTRAEDDPTTDYSVDYPPQVRWDLGEECRLSVGRDGDDGPWIVYVGLDVDQPDICCEVAADQLVEWARQVVKLVEQNGTAS